MQLTILKTDMLIDISGGELRVQLAMPCESAMLLADVLLGVAKSITSDNTTDVEPL